MIPEIDASTFAGQVQWFMCGFLYSAVIGSVGFMIKVFRTVGKDSVDL